MHDRIQHSTDDAHAEVGSDADLRLVVGMVDRAYAAGDDNTIRRRALVQEVAAAIDADAWIWVVSRFGGENEQPMCISMLHSGLEEETVAKLFEASQDLDAPPPENAPFIEKILAGSPFTNRREDMVSDDEWYNSKHLDRHRRAIDLNEFVYAVVPLAEGLFSAVGLHRGFGRPAFTERECRLAHIVITEAAYLHHGAVPDDTGEEIPDLSPRHRTVFGLLMQGWNRRRIATHLGLSEHTVRDHCRAVYRHFGVSDQRGLFVRFRTGTQAAHPS